MSRDAVDHALGSLNDDRDRIASALLDLENHPGYQLVKGTRLAGATRRRWEEAEARLLLLWRLFDAYQRVLDTAGELRARQSKPADATLRELSALLEGPSVELPLDEIPLEKRTLLGPTSERCTLDAAVERMTTVYGEVIDLVSAVNAAWEQLLGPLDEAEEGWREGARLAQSLETGRDAELDRIGRELAAAGQIVRTDPLALVRDGRADTSRLDQARADLDKVRAGLAEAARVRERYEQRVAAIGTSLARLDAVLDEARTAYRTVQVKIASPGVNEPHDPVPVLRERLDALAALHGSGRWPELADGVADLESTVAAAIDQATRARTLIAGLLERRDELRGRLDAYRVKAARLGFAEHHDLIRLHEEAGALLWTAPCDLQQSTVVLAQYQRVLRSLETGTD
ncbi:hypothetical protein [Thermomonospora umbrina]|nr:hypothetical protein [Thermomonospora umbrina]